MPDGTHAFDLHDQGDGRFVLVIGRCACRVATTAAVAIAAHLLIAAPLEAGTTGSISGRVLDSQQQPVVAATVEVEGQPLGAFTNAEGNYTILKVPPGTYSVTISRIGFNPVVTQGVLVTADHTTRVDATLSEAELATETVVVTAKRLPVDVDITSTRVTLTTREIEALPVQELQDVVNLQAGVVEGHFRGGRLGEVQYQVDGLSINNAYDNAPSLRVDRSLLQEVQIISGTFDAEYGQAMSGVVNAVLKQGSQRFRWSAEVFGGGFWFPGAENTRLTENTIQPAAIQNYQLTLSGPLFPQTVYFVSGRHYNFDNYVLATRLFVPKPTYDDTLKRFFPTPGDGAEEPLGFTREWSGALKITNSSIPNVDLNYQALLNVVEGRRTDAFFRFNPDGLSQQKTYSISHGFDWTQTLGKSSLFRLSLRQNYFDYQDHAYEDVFDPRYDDGGPPAENVNVPGIAVWGVEFTRFRQETNAYLLKGSIVNQASRAHQLKAGGELQYSQVRFGTPGHLRSTGLDVVRHVDEPPDFPGLRTYDPINAAAFVQDAVTLDDLLIRAGARLDYFDPRSTIPSDPANPANAIAGAPESVPVPTSTKVTLSPRLGVAYPVAERGAIHFAYGHFYQLPALGQIFGNADYSVLARLQAGGTDYGVLGNPDIKPEQTVQYEFGYKHALTDELGFDVTAFYKDIRDLLGVAFVSTYNDAEYAMLTNTDFGTVIGVTVALDHRKLGPMRVALDYTWQQAEGNSSDPRETATRASRGQDPRPRLVPFEWDQHHTFNMTVSLAGATSSASMVLRAASGQPYTPVLESAFGFGLEANSGRKPAGLVIDLRAEKRLRRLPGLGFFARVFNLLDTRYFNGAVFSSTGSPYYSRNPGDVVALNDPTRFYAPRRIEIGLTWNSGRQQAGGP
jgi:outer membrane receptor protein involved in Fe transport